MEDIQSGSRSWGRLPTELKDMILERATWEARSGARWWFTGQEQLGPLTTVCRDWQIFFERKLFKRLILRTEADLERFADIVQGRRRAYLEWLWLCIELPMYDCGRCHHYETREEVHVHRAIFTKLIWRLYHILSIWKPRDVRPDGIVLEVSAKSSSDAHHFNKDLRFRRLDTAWDRWDDRPVSPHNDPFHCWKDGKQVKRIPTAGAKYRLFGSGLRFDYTLPSVRRLHMRLPKVSVVTSFIIRRQFPRMIRASKSLHLMITSLTRLGSLTLEPWRGPTTEHLKFQSWHLAFMALESFKARRKTLKKVSIFESHDEIFRHGPSNRKSERWPAACLARRSHHLEELYVANKMDAVDFFYAFHPLAPPAHRRWMVWKDLKNLSLTTRKLVPGGTNAIILMAARAAERMPRLEVMELWNYWGSTGMAGIFRYRREETRATIELLGTWPDSFTRQARAAWFRVARAERPLPLLYRETYWRGGIIEGEYSVLRQLHLVEHLLHPISLRQIKREDQRRREERDA